MKEATIDMAKYNDSAPIHQECVGCAKVFDHILTTPNGENIETPKCLTYTRPAMWWNKRSIATAPVLVKDKANPKGILKDLPVVEFRCPVATHVSAKTVAEKAKINPLKASKRARG